MTLLVAGVAFARVQGEHSGLALLLGGNAHACLSTADGLVDSAGGSESLHCPACMLAAGHLAPEPIGPALPIRWVASDFVQGTDLERQQMVPTVRARGPPGTV